MAARELYIGLMSGTSIDAIDAALIRCTDQGCELLATLEHPIAPELRRDIAAISHPGADEIERLGRLDRQLGVLFADAVLALLASTRHGADDIAAVGSHGQTIRHRPPSAGNTPAFTLQIGDPNTIAELTGITTVADFRRRDIAAGGEGAPLAPGFHAAAFASEGRSRAIVNIGGIANITLLRGTHLVSGFDTGPGNTLLDHWTRRHRSLPYDRDGEWAAEGQVSAALLEQLRSHPYLARRGPRSTGKEAFNLAWLDSCLHTLPALDPRDVQATLAEITADSIASAITGAAEGVDEVYVCGGGARNTDLMRRLYRLLAPRRLDTTATLGMDPEWVEAAAFAWLAWRTLSGLAGNAAAVTGASGARVLGGIYPAGGV
ncbi:anhydro-N-acetylmuramic acid kinase [Haliea sp. E1-2-M8]|uniref:anhydro-N-acetylmuramic acid kinase n=1 Tax=Haliea sp. E1-2-M8 TaxID=3064706 RepID=UPI0027274F83|nr:anhydro-N-acetylmuramic acid kinase [Haliea sp. E1-2-M8]MDO8863851.1 anhydro-N-acetylmuramic acid kinase [Haliea sp. E1-2-M8]